MGDGCRHLDLAAALCSVAGAQLGNWRGGGVGYWLRAPPSQRRAAVSAESWLIAAALQQPSSAGVRAVGKGRQGDACFRGQPKVLGCPLWQCLGREAEEVVVDGKHWDGRCVALAPHSSMASHGARWATVWVGPSMVSGRASGHVQGGRGVWERVHGGPAPCTGTALAVMTVMACGAWSLGMLLIALCEPGPLHPEVLWQGLLQGRGQGTGQWQWIGVPRGAGVQGRCQVQMPGTGVVSGPMEVP